MSKICVVGAGYVGLVTAACLAKMRHDVSCVEVDAEKVAAIKNNRLPIEEPHLKRLWQRRLRLRITADYAQGLEGCQFIFLCLGTPVGLNGGVNLRQIISATTSIVENLGANDCPVVIIKSTVPVGTAELITALFRHARPGDNCPSVVSNPEFLREGHAVHDFLRPARIVIGSANRVAARRVAALYTPLACPIVFCDSRTAELIKYTSNAFLATKISFINEIAELCESYDVHVTKVAEVLGMDPRIGGVYLSAGLGWGGSCLPKDLAALIRMAAKQGVPNGLLTAVLKVNQRQPRLILNKLRRLLGSFDGHRFAVWGLTFKPDCADIRESPALTLIRLLQQEGGEVRAYDPVAMPAAANLLPALSLCSDPYSAATGSDAIILATGWREFQAIDFQRLRALVRRPYLVDARNTLPQERVEEADFVYVGVGRASLVPQPAESVLAVAATGPRAAARPGDGRMRPSLDDASLTALKDLIPMEPP